MYVIYQFDGLELAGYLGPGDSQNIGTGAALTQFYQLPGGGFYDAFRSKRSPQGIRPITKSFEIWADTQAELREKLDAIRAKIGVRGKLTVLYDDGEMSWQWARLQNVTSPRGEDVKTGRMPVEMTWITAAQNWYGIVQGEGWTWGDGSWTWGDGSATMGQNSFLFTIDATPSAVESVINGGNIYASNMRIKLYGKSGGGNATFRNSSIGQRFGWSGTFDADQRLIIDTGSRSVYRYLDNLGKSATQVAKVTSELWIDATSHGASVGEWWAIENTNNFDGIYQVSTIYSANRFGVRIDPELYDAPLESAGRATPIADEYANCTINDTKRWLSLKPGANLVRWDFGNYVAGMSYVVEFYDHWA